MKDFLKDVPKLEDLPKAMYRGLAVYVFPSITEGYCLIRRCDVRDNYISIESCKESELYPFIELTHWEASDFHKWFAENGMASSWVNSNSRGWQKALSLGDERIEISTDESHVSVSVPFSNIKSIRLNVCGALVKCTKPIK